MLPFSDMAIFHYFNVHLSLELVKAKVSTDSFTPLMDLGLNLSAEIIFGHVF